MKSLAELGLVLFAQATRKPSQQQEAAVHILGCEWAGEGQRLVEGQFNTCPLSRTAL